MGATDPLPINTGGGLYVAGDVQAARDFIGRDQYNISLQLKDVHDAARVTSAIAAAISKGDPVSQSILSDLLSLMEELRRTHSTLVKLISPLRRIKDDQPTFAAEFEAVYNDFRDFYDAYDFGEERTRCHKIRMIGMRLERQSAPITQTREWGELREDLTRLYNSDMDVIEAYYRPFTQRFNDVMIKMHDLVLGQQIAQAITLKRVFLDDLAPQYDAIKQMLRSMTDTIAGIEESLD